MTQRRQQLGRRGESVAADYLQSRGFTIVARRHRTRNGELDLIARRGKLLVFIEVKTRSSDRFGHPAEAVDPLKCRRIARAAAEYLTRFGGRPPDCRFDVISVRYGSPPVTGAPSTATVEHIEDAFRPY